MDWWYSDSRPWFEWGVATRSEISCFVGPKENRNATRTTSTAADCRTATLRPRAPKRVEPYTAISASDAHNVRFREKTTGNSDSGTSSRTSRSNQSRRTRSTRRVHEARTKGTRRAKLPPQSLVKTNGAVGRGTG